MSDEPRANAPVWHIQFCVEKIEANQVILLAGPNEGSQEPWMTWTKNVDSPRQEPLGNLKFGDRLFVRAVAVPDDEDVVFCLKFNNIAVKHFDFDDTGKGEFHKDDRDGECQC